jgi:hypothetical protein
MSEHFSQVAARMLEGPIGERVWFVRTCPRCGRLLVISSYRDEDSWTFECEADSCYLTKQATMWCNVFCYGCGCKCSIHLFRQGARPWHPSTQTAKQEVYV